MATTRLISIHQNKGKSITNCLADRIYYAINPNKTRDGELMLPPKSGHGLGDFYYVKLFI